MPALYDNDVTVT